MLVLKRRRALGMVAVACAVMAVGACATLGKGGSATSYPLIVDNRSDFEVVVYAMPTLTGNGIRIGNARSFSKTTMRIPRNALQSTDRLVLKINSIGSNAAPWTMPAATIDSSMTVALEIHADASGGLSRSVLYMDSGIVRQR
jgi:hypothetical protein